jgi:hypothetical protein
MRRMTGLSALFVTAVTVVAAQDVRKIDVSKPGPQGGGGVPIFSLPGEQGKTAKVSTRHLDVATYPSKPVVMPGTRFSLVTEITPHAGLHVYAPGATNYKTIELKVVPTKYIRPLRVVYPRAEIYTFKPLNERVPTYQKPFTLVQELMLENSAAARAALREKTSMTIGGALTYQACDDRLCYDPVSVPLSWLVGLAPNTLEHAVKAPAK